MLVAGLTGGIGSGKSTFCAAFSRLGVPVIDADVIYHHLTQPYSIANLLVEQQFGSQSLLNDGKLNKDWLRQIIFDDDCKKKQVEAIFHPLILDEIKSQISQLESNYIYCILAVPLLFEFSDFLNLSDYTIVIDCSEATQVARVMQRSGLSHEQVKKIIQAQMSRNERNRLADLVICNEEGFDSIDDKVSQLHKFLLEKS
ncbi:MULTISPECIES: dephospho-CoA kinase [Deefgea]|uniref:Dephospho-CoA kinase n=1 Tax=Deefgea chitinilytica TaxID=570276 RepID=A0ABS2CCM0_9NEIS|nr:MULTISPECIES: dephospho-CoA kinase [Deefgea]MBM5571880.1 dephospho-CoA kinase [Deefgea chitinilytica]MBM9889115.1 dephospho-CoA kinase [Deefgea sp. CFH1-16]